MSTMPLSASTVRRSKSVSNKPVATTFDPEAQISCKEHKKQSNRSLASIFKPMFSQHKLKQASDETISDEKGSNLSHYTWDGKAVYKGYLVAGSGGLASKYSTMDELYQLPNQISASGLPQESVTDPSASAKSALGVLSTPSLDTSIDNNARLDPPSKNGVRGVTFPASVPPQHDSTAGRYYYHPNNRAQSGKVPSTRSLLWLQKEHSACTKLNPGELSTVVSSRGGSRRSLITTTVSRRLKDGTSVEAVLPIVTGGLEDAIIAGQVDYDGILAERRTSG